MKEYIWVLILVLMAFSACSQPMVQRPPQSLMTQSAYQEREELKVSLFNADNELLSNEAAAKILDSKIHWPEKIAVVLYKTSEPKSIIRYYGYNYWLSEDYIDTEQRFTDTLIGSIHEAKRVASVSLLPSLLLGAKSSPNISALRAVALRMQADILMVYYLSSNTFSEWHLVKENEVKAYATCEVFLLDTRTGLIPFSTIITEKYSTKKEAIDANQNETKKRAESEAIVQCLGKAGRQIKDFFDKVP